MVDTFPNFIAVTIDATDARALAEFYRVLLGYVYREGDERPTAPESDPRGEDWLVLMDQHGTPRLALQQVAELARSTWPGSAVPQQLHLDLTVSSIEELATQYQRALSLGATVLADRSEDPEEPLYVFADPDGHPFCIFVSPPRRRQEE